MTLSTPKCSFKTQGSLLKLLLFILTLSSFSPFILSAPTDSNTITSPNNDKRHLEQREALPQPASEDMPHMVRKYTEDQNDILKREAGLRWGPVYIGNLKLSLTNPHEGYAGPKFPYANHVNFHVDKKDEGPRGTYSEVVNMHIVKYTNGDSNCLYAWDSVTKTTVFDSCFDDFSEAIEKCVSAVKDFVDTLLRNADFIASVAIIGALVVALAAALASLGAVAVA